MINNDSDRLQKIRERKAQLEKQEKMILDREKGKARKLDTRRKIIVGGIFLKYFPEFQTLEPLRTERENDVVFAPLARFLSSVTREKLLVEQSRQLAVSEQPAGDETAKQTDS